MHAYRFFGSRSLSAVAVLACALAACAHSEPPVAKPVAPTTQAPPPAPPLPPLTLDPAAEARVGLVATFVVPALEKSLASGVSLVKAAAPLPLDPAAVRDMLLNQMGLPPEAAKHLDLSTPISGASVVGGPGRGALNAFCFGVRSPADAAPLLAGLGRIVGRRGVAIQIENAAGDRGWFWPQGNVVIFADSEDALARAGNLAVEARRAAPDDVVVAINPEMMARAAGTDLKTALTRLLADIEQRSTASGNNLGPEATRQLKEMADHLLDTQTAELALNLDVAKGAALMARLLPRAGSKLETLARQTKTPAIDPAVAASLRDEKNGAGAVVSSAYGQVLLDQLRRQRGALPATGGKPAAAAGKLLDVMIEGLTGDFWMLGRARPSVSAEVVYQARDAAAVARIQTALTSVNKDALTALVRAATQGEAVEIKVQKASVATFGKSRGVTATVAVTSSAKNAATQGMLKLFDAKGVEVVAVGIPGDRIAMAMGPGARARIAALASGRPAPSATGKPGKSDKRAGATQGGAVLAGALGNAGTRSFFYLVDLRQAIAVLSTVGGDPRVGMLSAAMAGVPIPIFGGATGDGQGRSLTLDLTLPPPAFAGIGGLVQAAAMMPRN